MILLWVGLGLLALGGVGMAIERRWVWNGVALLAGLLCTGVFGATMLLGVNRSLAWVYVVAILASPLAILALAVGLILNGVEMSRREGRRPTNLLSLAAGLGLLGLDVTLVAVAATGAWDAIRWLLPPLAVATWFGFGFVAYLLYGFVYARLPIRGSRPVIVVLGSGLLGDRVPPLLTARLDRGIREFDRQRARGGDPVLIPSGGQGGDETRPEGAAMADYLVAHGVPEDAIAVEAEARTTRENLVNSVRLARERGLGGALVVVTNDYHALRAAVLSRRLKLDAQVLGAPTAGYFLPSALMREFAAIVVGTRWIHVAAVVVIAIVSIAVSRAL